MMRSFLLLALLLTIAANAQIIAPMGVCHDADATEEEVQNFCRSAEDCMYAPEGSVLGEDCYMRCNDMLDEFEEEYNCEDYGKVCHESVICIVPPVNLNAGGMDDDEEVDQNS